MCVLFVRYGYCFCGLFYFTVSIYCKICMQRSDLWLCNFFNLESTSEECLSFFICGGYEVVLDRANLTEFIFSYLWCSGMGPDFRVLVRKSRKQAEQYHRLYKVLLWSPLLFIFFPPSMVFTLSKF